MIIADHLNGYVICVRTKIDHLKNWYFIFNSQNKIPLCYLCIKYSVQLFMGFWNLVKSESYTILIS